MSEPRGSVEASCGCRPIDAWLARVVLLPMCHPATVVRQGASWPWILFCSTSTPPPTPLLHAHTHTTADPVAEGSLDSGRLLPNQAQVLLGANHGGIRGKSIPSEASRDRDHDADHSNYRCPTHALLDAAHSPTRQIPHKPGVPPLTHSRATTFQRIRCYSRAYQSS